MRLFLFCFLVITWSGTKAQTGNYFLFHYSPTEEKIDFRSHDMVQDVHGELYFANRAGVLEFDGFTWNVISVPGAVYTLIADSTDVLIGGLTGAGRLNGEIQSPPTPWEVSKACEALLPGRHLMPHILIEFFGDWS